MLGVKLMQDMIILSALKFLVLQKLGAKNKSLHAVNILIRTPPDSSAGEPGNNLRLISYR